MNEYMAILKKEFSANDDTFLIKLRSYSKWDKEAFYRLTEAMRECCIDMENKDELPRFLCDGFYFASHFIRDFTKEGNYRKEHSKKYYEKAYRRLNDLESWFFRGRSPYLNGVGFEPIE